MLRSLRASRRLLRIGGFVDDDDFTAIDRPCAMTPPGYGVWVRVMVAEGFVPQRFLGCSAASVEED